MKALVGTFNQEALVGGFSVIVKTNCETHRSSAALLATLALPVGHVHHHLARQQRRRVRGEAGVAAEGHGEDDEVRGAELRQPTHPHTLWYQVPAVNGNFSSTLTKIPTKRIGSFLNNRLLEG